MNTDLIISAYGSHNGRIILYYNGIYKIVELERWLNIKNIGLTTYMACRYPQSVFDEITDFLLKGIDKQEVDLYLTNYVNNLTPKFPYKQHLEYDHHLAHAATAFYQSSYKKSLVFTFDGGGDGGFFNVYVADKINGIALLDKFNQDLGYPYMIICNYMDDINKESLSIGNLVYPGKIMGLCSYGIVRDEWISHFDNFYTKFNYIGNSYIGGREASYDALTSLFNSIGFKDFDFENSRFTGQDAWDIAATSQKSFENQFFKFAQVYLNEYPDLPVCMSGGCALNVLLNTKLLKLRNNNVFVPPNVNDSGIALGGALLHIRPELPIDITYSGVPILDDKMFGNIIQDRNLTCFHEVTSKEIAELLADGNILGVINGNSEHGSRALGNRSILCDPSGDMKNVLNEKVKHREWYRPFAPVVRLQNAHKYFEWDEGIESRYMTFITTVREEWRDKLKAVTHEDFTARLQTVTYNQNPKLYDILTEFENITGYDVLLNTSFNDAGKPILSTLGDALHILQHTDLDALLVNNTIIFCTGNEYKFAREKINNSVIKQTMVDKTTTYLISFPKNKREEIKHRKFITKLLNKNIPIVIITSDDNNVGDLVSDNKYIQLHAVGDDKLYYDSLILNKIPKIKKSITAFAGKIKMLWCKDAILENVYNTTHHLLIDIDEYQQHYNDITNDIKFLINIHDDIITVSHSNTNTSDIFTNKYLFEKYDKTYDKFPTHAYVVGNSTNMEWFCNNQEGVFLWYMNQNKVASISEYMLISYIENLSRYKLLD